MFGKLILTGLIALFLTAAAVMALGCNGQKGEATGVREQMLEETKAPVVASNDITNNKEITEMAATDFVDLVCTSKGHQGEEYRGKIFRISGVILRNYHPNYAVVHLDGNNERAGFILTMWFDDQNTGQLKNLKPGDKVVIEATYDSFNHAQIDIRLQFVNARLISRQ